MSSKNKKKTSVLVIGGQGYIGNVVCKDLLSVKYKVISIDNKIYDQKIESNFLKNKDYRNYNFSISKKKKF